MNAVLLACLLLTLPVQSSDSPPLPGQPSVSFTRDVYPILSRNCLQCHGPQQQNGDFRIDSRDSLLHPDILRPRSPQASELLRRITLPSTDEQHMPPIGNPLTQPQQQLIRQWIDAGAAIPDPFIPPPHWAWSPPVRPELPPQITDSPIDAFIRQTLDSHQLQPAPQADPAVLVRRLYLALIGLPPTPAEVAAFAADPSETRYQQLVDELLQRPQFGERWARHWLDLARYADSHGFQRDDLRDSWAWRDWVIQALNRDQPFDQFTIEQLAGDLLPNATEAQRVATGFHRCSPTNVEAGSLPEETRAEQLIDRVNTTATIWLGATLECAQCHDHKYDPFSMQDYYQLLACFNNTALEADRANPAQPSSIRFIGPEMPLSDPRHDEQRAALNSRLAELQQKLKRQRSSSSANEKSAADQPRSDSAPVVLKAESIRSLAAADTWNTLPDGSILVSGDAPPADDLVTVTVRQPLQNIIALRLEALPHDSLPGKGPGRGDKKRPNFVLHEFTATLTEGDADPLPLRFTSATADFSQQNWDVAGAVDGQPKTGWAIAPRFAAPHHATFRLASPLTLTENSILTIRLDQHFGSGRSLGRFRLSALFSDSDPETEQLQQQLQQVQDSLAALAPATTLVMVEQQPRPAFIFQRGDYRQPGAAVQPGIPALFRGSQPAPQPQNRLELARWLVSPANPLAARAAVNRWWAELFGTGLVATPEDLGSRCEPPSHPELLDWLAVELIENGWSMKHVLRRIVLSRTFRQSADSTRQLQQLDDQNRLLARGPSFRMDAEMIRDNLLAASGLLDLKQFGPPIRPPQPAGFWNKVGGQQYDYQVSPGTEKYRRSIYIVLKRSAIHPSLSTFDGPARFACTVQRSRTSTALQALALLNEPVSVDAATALAGRMLSSPGADTDSRRLTHGFQLCTARTPEPAELLVLLQLLKQQREALRQRSPADAHDTIEQAAWHAVAGVLLNLHETITRP
ncbi:MAG: PSD1 and planctomycete cytochrome C domain-containing protein [Planctomyces sp.]